MPVDGKHSLSTGTLTMLRPLFGLVILASFFASPVSAGDSEPVRKPFGPMSFAKPGRVVPVSREVEEIALRAGAALGLGLYGLDMIENPAGPVVVDLNYFPGYKGCPGVAAPMAAYIDAYAHGLIDLPVPARPAARVGTTAGPIRNPS